MRMGKIREHVSYYQFKNGDVKYDKTNEILNDHTYHIGEKTVCTNEMIATIIAYRSSQDIDIQFDDGLIVEHVIYNSFRQKSFTHPDRSPVIWNQSFPGPKDIGRKKRTLDGYRELIAINEDRTVDYIDDNGEVVLNGTYLDFLRKNMTLQKSRRKGVSREYIR